MSAGVTVAGDCRAAPSVGTPQDGLIAPARPEKCRPRRPVLN